MDYYDGYDYNDDDRAGRGGGSGGDSSNVGGGIAVFGGGVGGSHSGSRSASSSGNRVLLQPSLLSGLHKEFANGPGVVEKFPNTHPDMECVESKPHTDTTSNLNSSMNNDTGRTGDIVTGGRSMPTGGRSDTTGGRNMPTGGKFAPNPTGGTNVIASLRAQLKREQQRRGGGLLGVDGEDDGDEGAMYVMGGRGRQIRKSFSGRKSYLSHCTSPHLSTNL